MHPHHWNVSIVRIDRSKFSGLGGDADCTQRPVCCAASQFSGVVSILLFLQDTSEFKFKFQLNLGCTVHAVFSLGYLYLVRFLRLLAST